eukprot:71911-Prorocentrum_lima.AAC.1
MRTSLPTKNVPREPRWKCLSTPRTTTPCELQSVHYKRNVNQGQQGSCNALYDKGVHGHSGRLL